MADDRYVSGEIKGYIEIPAGVDVRIAFERVEGGYRMDVYNAGKVQSILLRDASDVVDDVEALKKHRDDMGLSVVDGKIMVTYEEEDET